MFKDCTKEGGNRNTKITSSSYIYAVKTKKINRNLIKLQQKVNVVKRREYYVLNIISLHAHDWTLKHTSDSTATNFRAFCLPPIVSCRGVNRRHIKLHILLRARQGNHVALLRCVKNQRTNERRCMGKEIFNYTVLNPPRPENYNS